jgi:hypothetical protein
MTSTRPTTAVAKETPAARQDPFVPASFPRFGLLERFINIGERSVTFDRRNALRGDSAWSADFDDDSILGTAI